MTERMVVRSSFRGEKEKPKRGWSELLVGERRDGGQSCREVKKRRRERESEVAEEKSRDRDRVPKLREINRGEVRVGVGKMAMTAALAVVQGVCSELNREESGVGFGLNGGRNVAVEGNPMTLSFPTKSDRDNC